MAESGVDASVVGAGLDWTARGRTKVVAPDLVRAPKEIT